MNFLMVTFCFFIGSIYAQDIAINEFMSSNVSGITDEDGSFEDWIEIYNYGNSSVNLSGFGLSDQVDNPFKWVFPNRELAPNEYLIVWASDKTELPQVESYTPTLKLNQGVRH